MPKVKVLVVDDEHLIRWSLEQHLKKRGHDVLTAGNGEAAMELVRDEHPDLVLLDIGLPGISGLEVLEQIREFDEDIMVIMVTAVGSLEMVVTAMRRRAYSYLTKPFELQEVSLVIDKALDESRLKKTAAGLRCQQSKTVPSITFTGQAMEGIMGTMALVAKSEATTVLVQGESGTGKELVAQWIHHGSSRAGKPFMAINCAAVPATLLESELFGHEKGAFTDAKATKKGLLELANGGTVFLDEIGEMELGMQAKLLRFLEDRSFRRVGGTKVIKVDVRIISATHRDLVRAIAEREFRSDLYYRLQVIPITLPPLRERKEDILPLVEVFIKQFNNELKKRVRGLSKAAAHLLTEYRWPGNIRELKNVIERAMILCDEESLLAEHFPFEVTGKTWSGSATSVINLPPEGVDIEDVERDLVRQALDVAHWNLHHAAAKLKISVPSLRYRMKKFGYLD